jgi:hypothetical protein
VNSVDRLVSVMQDVIDEEWETRRKRERAREYVVHLKGVKVAGGSFTQNVLGLYIPAQPSSWHTEDRKWASRWFKLGSIAEALKTNSILTMPRPFP